MRALCLDKAWTKRRKVTGYLKDGWACHLFYDERRTLFTYKYWSSEIGTLYIYIVMASRMSTPQCESSECVQTWPINRSKVILLFTFSCTSTERPSSSFAYIRSHLDLRVQVIADVSRSRLGRNRGSRDEACRYIKAVGRWSTGK